MQLSNPEYEWEFFKALLSDPYNPESSVIGKLEAADFTKVNQPYFRYLRAAWERHGYLDAGAFVELATDHEVDQTIRQRLLELVAEVQGVPFPLARMAQELTSRKSRYLAAEKLEKALKGPSEALESATREALSILEGTKPLDDAPTLSAEWAELARGIPIVDPQRTRPRLQFALPMIDHSIQTGPGNLGVLAAKPSAGKSSLALQAAIVTARAGIPVMFLGLEMPRAELACRAVAWETGIGSFDLLRGHVPAVGGAPEWIDNLHVYDRIPKGAFDEAAAMIRRAARRGIQTVIVDYWTLIYPPDSKVRGAGSAYLLGEMSRGFKQLARELQIHVVLVSQFNREAKDGGRPSLENLRETGQLEQDASWVLMMWAEKGEYGPHDNRNVWCELQKNRGGPRWVKCYTTFNPTNGRFYEVEPPELKPTGRMADLGRKK